MRTMVKIKSNIVELEKLYSVPCEDWYKRFEEGKIDAHHAFKVHGEEYVWLYNNSPYDLIGWEIEHGVFDWEEHSWAVAQCCPEHFNPKKFNWERFSDFVAKYCPNLIDPDKFNWTDDSWAVAMYCPDKLDPVKFDWEKCSDYVARFCPDRIDPVRFNWEKYSGFVAKYFPELLKLKPCTAV